MSASTRLRLPYLAPAQAQKHVAINESIRLLDALVQLSAKSRTLAAEPLSPADGDCYILPAGKTGPAWGPMANGAVAYYVDGAWMELPPREGWLAFLHDTDVLVAYDGAAWTPVSAAAGGGGAPTPAINDNLLVNGDFQINQRGFAGGALAAGAFGFDRWKAAAGGANVTRAGFTVTLHSGEIEQVVEPALFGLASFASQVVTVSVEAPSADLVVTFGSQSATIPAGAGRRAASLTLAAGDTGNRAFKLKKATGSGVTFARVKLELGPTATDWRARDDQAERALCQRYWQPSTGATGNLFNVGFINAAFPLIAPMRAVPSVSVLNGASAVDRPGVASYDVTGVSVVFGAGPTGLLVQATTNGTSIGICSVYPNALAFSAEL